MVKFTEYINEVIDSGVKNSKSYSNNHGWKW